MKRAVWFLLLGLGTGCGGQELLLDATPPILIPNGGSAQAGQVEGPTAILVTGDGAILPPREAEIVASPGDASAEPPAARSVEEQASLEALGEPSGEDGEPTSSAADVEPDEDESAPRGDPGSQAVVAPATPLALSPRSRSILGAGYVLEIPAAWESLDPSGLGSSLIVSASRSMDPGDGFFMNVIVSAEPFGGDARAYATSNVPSLLEAGCSLRDSQPAEVSGRAAVDVEAWWPNITGAPYITLQRYATNGEAGFVVTCAAAATAFESEREVCLDLLDSFRFE